MTITAAIRTRIRRYIGDSSTPYTFSDDEISTIYDDNDEDLESSVLECIEVLMADASKRVTYRQGQSFEDENKLFEHLEKLRKLWSGKAGKGAGAVRTGALTHTFYDDDGTAIPYDPAEDDDYGWLLN